MSHASTSSAPVPATQPIERRTLSPMTRLTTLGTTRPRNGIMPAVTSTVAVMTAMTTIPTATTRR